MVISDLSGLPKTAETAVIINAGTKYVTRFALLSTLRHAQVPTIVLDCASRDVSFGWFEHLLADHEFYLMPAKLRLHGQTLDWIFTQIPSDQVLLVDSDVELLNNAMISRMRSMLNDSQEAYGSGYLHPAHWLEYHYWSDLPLARGIGYYMARPWIPFALLRVGPVRAAFAHGRSFVHRLVMNDIPASPLLSRLLWRRFSLEFFRTHRLSYLDSFRGSYNSERPSYVSYDTGADIHEFLTQEQGLGFESVSADFVPWSVIHFSGITRGSLYKGSTNDAYKLSDAHPIIVKRLREFYGMDVM